MSFHTSECKEIKYKTYLNEIKHITNGDIQDVVSQNDIDEKNLISSKDNLNIIKKSFEIISKTTM